MHLLHLYCNDYTYDIYIAYICYQYVDTIHICQTNELWIRQKTISLVKNTCQEFVDGIQSACDQCKIQPF